MFSDGLAYKYRLYVDLDEFHDRTIQDWLIWRPRNKFYTIQEELETFHWLNEDDHLDYYDEEAGYYLIFGLGD